MSKKLENFKSAYRIFCRGGGGLIFEPQKTRYRHNPSSILGHPRRFSSLYAITPFAEIMIFTHFYDYDFGTGNRWIIDGVGFFSKGKWLYKIYATNNAVKFKKIS